MTGFSEQCVEKYCELANVDTNFDLITTWTPHLDDAKITDDMKTDKRETAGSCSKNCAQVLVQCKVLSLRYPLRGELACTNGH